MPRREQGRRYHVAAIDARQTTKRVEIGLVSISNKKFLTTPGEVVSVVVEAAPLQEYRETEGKPRWKSIGLATFDTRAGAWIVSSYNLTEYVLKARATRKDSRVQEARAVALTGTSAN